jgi:hypothetical protein
MNPFSSIGRVSSRLFRNPDERRRPRLERAERAWRAREALRDARRPTTVFPGPATVSVWPQRASIVTLAVIGLFSIAAMTASRVDAAPRHGRDDDASVICRHDLRLPVALAAGQPTSYIVSG